MKIALAVCFGRGPELQIGKKRAIQKTPTTELL
jgi:hypothetical protein